MTTIGLRSILPIVGNIWRSADKTGSQICARKFAIAETNWLRGSTIPKK